MRTLIILYLKELNHYYKSPFGWVVIAFVLIMQGLCFTTSLETYQDHPTTANLFFLEFSRPIFSFFFVFLFPLITMRLFAEEERIGTREPLMTAPVKTWHVLLGKYFATYTFFMILWLPLLLHTKLFEMITNTPPPIENGEILGSFAFLYLTGGFFCALGCLASSLTSSQIIAGIVTTASVTFFIFLGYVTNIWGENFAAANFFHYISFGEHQVRFSRGLVDTSTIVLYVSLAMFTLVITHQVIDFRRWKN